MHRGERFIALNMHIRTGEFTSVMYLLDLLVSIMAMTLAVNIKQNSKTSPGTKAFITDDPAQFSAALLIYDTLWLVPD